MDDSANTIMGKLAMTKAVPLATVQLGQDIKQFQAELHMFVAKADNDPANQVRKVVSFRDAGIETLELKKLRQF